MGRIGQVESEGVVALRAERATVAGNPLDMEGDEGQRDVMCAAHVTLLQCILPIEEDGPVPTQAHVQAIGRDWGVKRRIHVWDGRYVRADSSVECGGVCSPWSRPATLGDYTLSCIDSVSPSPRRRS